jgi:hypothetical protein
VKYALLALAVVACGDPKLTVDELQNPETCKECHPKHYDQWSGSMHAYAADDPVFIAMNKKGQRDTNGELGDFCINCHAPMAVKLGLASGATFDSAALPPEARGVTCYFCHNVTAVEGEHNNPLVLGMDQTMRGGLKDPVESSAHYSKYDGKLMAGATNDSTMCGACHDLVTPKGVHLERTFAEWKETVFAVVDPKAFLPQTCSNCHMRSSDEPIADAPGVGSRENGYHEHMWPSVDQALTPFPQMAEQAAGIKDILDPSIQVVGLKPLGSFAYGGICLDPPGVLSVRIDSINVGHNFPSGAAQDRRAWLEVIAYNASGTQIWSSGVVPDGMDPEQINDPTLFGFWDKTFKADGSSAHFFWEVDRVESKLLKGAVTLDANSPLYDHSSTAKFTIGPQYTNFERITTRMRMRALPYEVIDELIASGDLAAGTRAELKTIDLLGTQKEWLRSTKGTGDAINTNCSPR